MDGICTRVRIGTEMMCPHQKKSWPPSPSIDPLLISIHFYHDFVETALADESVEFLKQHAPIGARDLGALKILQENEYTLQPIFRAV